VLPAWLDPFAGTGPGDYASANAGRLARSSGRLRVAGELVAFAGAIVAFMATLFRPANPAELAALDGWIFVPGSLGQVPFTSPTSYAVTQADNLSPLTLGLALGLITLMGAGAIIRGRWLLAGLVGAFFLLPWSLVGFDLTLKPLVLPLYGLLLVFRLYRPSTWKLMLLAPLIVVGSPIVIPLFGGIYDQLGRTAQTATYRKIAFADLIANQGKPAQETTANGKPVVRVTSLSGLSAPALAMPYVMAQEYALRGDASAAASALDEAAMRGFRPNAFDKRRMDAIEDYAANQGARGPLRQSSVRAAYETRAFLAWIGFVASLVLVAAGMASRILTGHMARRAGRIDDAEDRLRTALASKQAHDLAPRSGHGSGPQPSPAVFDSQATMAAMSRRIRAYAKATGWLAAVASVCTLGWWWYRLPQAASNTAFERIELVSEVVKFAREAEQSGLSEGAISDATRLYVLFAALFLYFTSLPIIKSRRYQIGMALAGALYCFVLPNVFFPHSGNTVALSELRPDLRASLTALVASDLSASPGAASKAGSLSATSEMTGAGIMLPQAASSAAAYTLAQIAYLENRPADAAAMLNRMSDRSIIRQRSTEQRTDLMIEWVVAHGQPAPAWLSSPKSDRPTAFGRSLAAALSIIATAAAVAMLLPLGLLGYARHRRSRIKALVSERQGGQFDNDATARQRLMRIGERGPVPG